MSGIITLGIGPGATITELLTAGLQIGVAVPIITPDGRRVRVPARSSAQADGTRRVKVPSESRSG